MDTVVPIEYRNEILSTLEKIFLHQNPILVGQIMGEDKIECWALIQHIDTVTNEITLKPVNNDEHFHFDNKLNVRVKNASESITFESEMTTLCLEKIISLKIPGTINLSNTRNNTRYHYEDYNFPLQLNNQTLTNSPHAITGTLLDISISGIAIRIECNEIEFFHQNDTLQLLDISNFAFADTLGTIVYIRKIKEAGATKYYKLGVHFNELISLPALLKYLKGNE